MLTNKQIEDLHAAISAAINPGKCQYVVDGAPSCVIAQLYTIRGGSLESLEKFEGGGVAMGLGGQPVMYFGGERFELPELADFPGNLLSRLQGFWDERLKPTEELWERRAKLRDIVAGWVTT